MKIIFFKKPLNFKLNTNKSKINCKLKLFQSSFSLKKNFKKTIWLNLNQTNFTFKSFFGFLKQKPFVTKVKLNFLKNFFLNPKPYTFRQIISQTKKYKPEVVNNFFLNPHNPNYISKLKLKYLFFKKNTVKKKKITFLLFKHKIFNYTTAKHVLIKKPAQLYNSSYEFRTGIDFFTKLNTIPNISTISTYNWKSIN